MDQSSLALAGQLRELCNRLRAPQVDDFLREWPHDLGPVHSLQPRVIRAVRWLDALAAGAPAFAAPFVARLAAVARDLPWRQSYSARRMGSAFWDNYGYCELVGMQAALASTRLAVGVLLLGPHTEYPAHWHEAEELYVPLVGTAHWWHGVQAWRSHSPGALIHHARHEPHAMRTAAEPLLALYLWRSHDVSQHSRLLARSTLG
jgi:uncharacterized RmlC-like cupin family protein